MESEPGTYALVLRVQKGVRLSVGRRHELGIERGYYVYIGSAFGPGGVGARVRRHCRVAKPNHWHIDYLREHSIPLGAWISYEPIHLEHRWAEKLCDAVELTTIPGFGCSDCNCSSHLFFTSSAPAFALYSRYLGGRIEEWIYRRTA